MLLQFYGEQLGILRTGKGRSRGQHRKRPCPCGAGAVMAECEHAKNLTNDKSVSCHAGPYRYDQLEFMKFNF